MRCPECHFADTKVVDSRTSGDDAIRRRRECLKCEARFTTHERVERPMLWVVKKDGTREPFDRDKLLRGLSLACRKRPVTTARLDEVVRKLEQDLELNREGEVTSTAVGQAVLEVLRDVDEVAWVRFASVYRAFESVDQFVHLVRPGEGRSST